MKKSHRHLQAGFTFIELIVFIVVSSILMTTLLLSTTTTLQKTPVVHQQWVALQIAKGCMEWFLAQRRLNGYDALSCPSSPSTTFCATPSGYAITASISCTTWNSDNNYKTITVAVSGLADATLITQIGNY